MTLIRALWTCECVIKGKTGWNLPPDAIKCSSGDLDPKVFSSHVFLLHFVTHFTHALVFSLQLLVRFYVWPINFNYLNETTERKHHFVSKTWLHEGENVLVTDLFVVFTTDKWKGVLQDSSESLLLFVGLIRKKPEVLSVN